MGKWYTLMDAAPGGTAAQSDLFPIWVQVLVGILILAVVVIVLYWFFGDLFRALLSKKRTVEATLDSKLSEEYVSQTMYVNSSQSQVTDGLAEKGKEYYARFILENGKTINLQIPKNVYQVAVEGSKGILTYRGKHFISYDARTEGTVLEPEDIVETLVSIDRKF